MLMVSGGRIDEVAMFKIDDVNPLNKGSSTRFTCNIIPGFEPSIGLKLSFVCL
jgi:hypothetical protein